MSVMDDGKISFSHFVIYLQPSSILTKIQCPLPLLYLWHGFIFIQSHISDRKQIVSEKGNHSNSDNLRMVSVCPLCQFYLLSCIHLRASVVHRYPLSHPLYGNETQQVCQTIYKTRSPKWIASTIQSVEKCVSETNFLGDELYFRNVWRRKA